MNPRFPEQKRKHPLFSKQKDESFLLILFLFLIVGIYLFPDFSNTMNNNSSYGWLQASLLPVIDPPAFISGERQKKPNVLFIISDDLTATAVSSYENNLNQTPNIDRLASEGVRFTRAYSQFPECGPSRASMMFGYYPDVTGSNSYPYISREEVGPDRNSWSQLFKKNGYYTARVSKIYHMGVPPDIEEGLNGRDDEASWTERFNSQGPEWKAAGESELVQNNPHGLKPKEGGNVMTIVKAEGDDLLHSDGKTAEKASELIRKHKGEPFFLAVGFVRPHVPFVAPKKYFEPFPYQQMVLPPQVENDWDDLPPQGINWVNSVKLQMSVEQEKKALGGYYASVSYMDAQVGKVLQTLREEGLEDNTIIIFVSDHGFHLGEHRFWMKMSLHEESVRVPLIIKVPGKKPAVSHSLVELLDLYPTVAELAGLNYSEHLQGKSLAKTIDDPEHAVRDAAFSISTRQGEPCYLLRSSKWAFIQYGESNTSDMELYDMEHDSKQYNNLAGNPLYQDVIADFQKKLNMKLNEIRDNDLHVMHESD